MRQSIRQLSTITYLGSPEQQSRNLRCTCLTQSDILDSSHAVQKGPKNKNQFMRDRPNSRCDELLYWRYCGCVWVRRFASARAARAAGSIFARTSSSGGALG